MKQNGVNNIEYNKDMNFIRKKFRTLKEGCIKAILLFGSRARGEAKTRSDIDLLVLHDGCGIKDPIERREYLYNVIRNTIGKTFEDITVIDMEFNHFLNPEEIPSLLLNIYWDGISIYDKSGELEEFLVSVKKKIKRSGLERVKDGKAYYWILPKPLKEVKIL